MIKGIYKNRKHQAFPVCENNMQQSELKRSVNSSLCPKYFPPTTIYSPTNVFLHFHNQQTPWINKVKQLYEIPTSIPLRRHIWRDVRQLPYKYTKKKKMEK